MARMTVSQALRRIAKLKGEHKELLERAQKAVTYSDNDPPAFPFADSIASADRVREELVKLEAAVRKSNSTWWVDLPGGREITVGEAIARLQEHRARIAWLRALPVFANPQRVEYVQAIVDRQYQHVQVITRCALPEANRAAAVQREQEAFDQLNDAVEHANHLHHIDIDDEAPPVVPAPKSNDGLPEF